eukprot:SAG22_NODE_335_length_12071_cov_5.268771_4_plen_387_part_00
MYKDSKEIIRGGAVWWETGARAQTAPGRQTRGAGLPLASDPPPTMLRSTVRLGGAGLKAAQQNCSPAPPIAARACGHVAGDDAGAPQRYLDRLIGQSEQAQWASGSDMGAATRAVAVLPYTTRPFGGEAASGGGDRWSGRMAEAVALCTSVGSWRLVDGVAIKDRRAKLGGNSGDAQCEVVHKMLRPGQVAELRRTIRAADAEIVFVDTQLRPAALQRLASTWGVRVVDRFGLILEIFAANATTKEAQLQLELAAAQYDRTQLVRDKRSGLFLGGQASVVSARGGRGGASVGGGGEMQIELERRRLRQQAQNAKVALRKVATHRQLLRSGRRGAVVVCGHFQSWRDQTHHDPLGARSPSRLWLACLLIRFASSVTRTRAKVRCSTS